MSIIDVQQRGGGSSTKDATPTETTALQSNDQPVKRVGSQGGSTSVKDLLFNEQSDPTQYGDPALLAAYHSVPLFHAAVSRVATAVAETDFYLERDGERLPDHPASQIIQSPNREQSGYEYRYCHQIFVEVLGDGFSLLDETDEHGRELILVPPTNVSKRRNDDGAGKWAIEHNRLREAIPEDRVVWVKTPDIRDPYGRGTGKGRVLADEIETDELTSRHINREFANNAVPSFILWLPGATDDKAEDVADEWRSLLRGPDSAGEGLFKATPASDSEFDFMPQYQEVSRTLEDMEADRFRELTSELILQCFGIPPELVGRIEDSNRATIESANYLFARWTLKPRLAHLADEWEQNLLPLFGDTEGVSIEYEDPVPEDKQFKLEVAKEFPFAFTVNEIRELHGLPPREGGEVYKRPPEAKARFVEAGELQDQSTSTPQPDDRQDDDSAEAKDHLPDDGVIELDFSNPDTVRVKQGDDDPPDNPEDASSLDEAAAAAATAGFIRVELKNAYEDEVRRWVQIASRRIGQEPQLGVLTSRIQEHVEEFSAEKVVQINEGTREEIRRIVSGALAEGRNPRDIAEDIEDLDGLDQLYERRGETIARTEMNRASSWGSHQAKKASGVVDKRRWVASSDSRTRTAHQVLGGEVPVINAQVQPIDEPFEHRGEEAMFPGGFGVPELDINCRCSTAAVFDRDKIHELRSRGYRPSFVALPGGDHEGFEVYLDREALVHGWQSDGLDVPRTLKDGPIARLDEQTDGPLTLTDRDFAKVNDAQLEASEERFKEAVSEVMSRQLDEQVLPAMHAYLDANAA